MKKERVIKYSIILIASFLILIVALRKACKEENRPVEVIDFL